MVKTTAGLLPFRRGAQGLEVFLVHPGGPFWARKDEGAWSIPKGEIDEDEDPLAAACRELEEETGFTADGVPIPLASIRQRSGKIVHAWAMELNLDPGSIRSGTFSIEWPPRSGRQREFPEVDRAGWFSLEAARAKILSAQVSFLEELEVRFGKSESSPDHDSPEPGDF